MKTLVRSQRWRRTFVAACLPYLLLSVFVDFIHLHPPVRGDASELSASANVAGPETHTPCLPESPCAVCLWMQAGTSLQPSVSAGPAVIAISSDLTPRPVADPARPALLSPAFRGPPPSLFA